jgi:hypothetical protein
MLVADAGCAIAEPRPESQYPLYVAKCSYVFGNNERSSGFPSVLAEGQLEIPIASLSFVVFNPRTKVSKASSD